jgi:hypothetical protein
MKDEELDSKLRELLNRSAADESLVNDIADSPSLWWNVQRRINTGAETKRSPWPPVNTWLRWLAIGVPAAAAVVIAAFFVLRPAAVSDMSSEVQNDVSNQPAVTQTRSAAEPPSEVTTLMTGSTVARQKRAALRHAEAPSPKLAKISGPKEPAATTGPRTDEVVKTEFIALSYARDPESGQLVRVKVPSSMMVSLGLVTSVKRPTELVDAEVLVGDDGLTRAIRFIR